MPNCTKFCGAWLVTRITNVSMIRKIADVVWKRHVENAERRELEKVGSVERLERPRRRRTTQHAKT